LGAVVSRCSYLLTADKRCFGKFFGRKTHGVTVTQVGRFLRDFGDER
jgi:hypothetical protein